MKGDPSDVAFDATFRQAAPYQIQRDRSDVALGDRDARLAQKGARAPSRELDSLRHGCELVDGGCRADDRHQRRDHVALD